MFFLRARYTQQDVNYFFLNSQNFRPFGAAMYASLTLHSFGIVQSNTDVPLGTSCSVRFGSSLWIIPRVSLTPSPVMLRAMGHRIFARAKKVLSLTPSTLLNELENKAQTS